MTCNFFRFFVYDIAVNNICSYQCQLYLVDWVAAWHGRQHIKYLSAAPFQWIDVRTHRWVASGDQWRCLGHSVAECEGRRWHAIIVITCRAVCIPPLGLPYAVPWDLKTWNWGQIDMRPTCDWCRLQCSFQRGVWVEPVFPSSYTYPFVIYSDCNNTWGQFNGFTNCVPCLYFKPAGKDDLLYVLCRTSDHMDWHRYIHTTYAKSAVRHVITPGRIAPGSMAW